MFLSELSPLSSSSSDNILLGWINIDTRCTLPNNCLITSQISRSLLKILVLLKTKFNASKKRSKQTWDKVYAKNSSIEFVLLFLIPIGRGQNTVNILLYPMPSSDYSMMLILLLHIILKIARLAISIRLIL